MKADSLYDEVWHRVRETVSLNREYQAEGKKYISMYEFYTLGFMRKHTIPFKNYKSEDLIPELEKHLNEIENRNKSSNNAGDCPILFGGKEFRKFMLQISEEFLLERLLFWRDYKEATGLMLEYPCERLLAPFIVYFYRMRNRFYEMNLEERIKRTEQFKKAFTKRMEKFEAVNSALLHFKQKSYLSRTGKAEYEISKAFFNEASVSNRLKQIMFEIEHFVKYVLEDPCFFSDCNYWGRPHISEEEGRKILEEIE